MLPVGKAFTIDTFTVVFTVEKYHGSCYNIYSDAMYIVAFQNQIIFQCIFFI